MLPIAIVWLFLPFVWLIIYLFARIEGELSRRGPRIALAVAIILYVISKFFIFPSGFVEAAPLIDRLPAAVAGVYLLALPTAIAAFTMGSAYVNHLDDRTGSIEVGKLADLVVLSDDLFELDSPARARVLLTLVGGRVVYEAEDSGL
ncbi:MAG: amidohydrolase family protein [Anaerolineae bacterium]|nr:amidohydrolase family protein [Anaerolineae bacterium]